MGHRDQSDEIILGRPRILKGAEHKQTLVFIKNNGFP